METPLNKNNLPGKMIIKVEGIGVKEENNLGIILFYSHGEITGCQK
jgi:hypothetical protein